MWQDPAFWYGVSFVIFLGLAWHYGRRPILNWLDSEILKIREQLAQAQKLREEAEATLVQYKTKYASAMAEAKTIVSHAKAEAANLKKQAEAELKEALARHVQQAEERIRLAESDAMAQVRAAAIDTAMAMARKTLASDIDSAQAAKLADQAIAELPQLAQTKAKAA
jgi:F-type H+-transporting ATPase subunit b